MDLFLRQWVQQDGVSELVDKSTPCVIPGHAAVWGSISDPRLGNVMT
jgi:hypothetical protein